MTTQPQNNDLRRKAAKIFVTEKLVAHNKKHTSVTSIQLLPEQRDMLAEWMLEFNQEQGQREVEQAQEFFPMSHRPQKSKDDEEFSETVLAYSDDLDYSDLAYFDFKTDEWAILGDFSFIMKCWMPIPKPKSEAVKNFTEAKHRGFC